MHPLERDIRSNIPKNTKELLMKSFHKLVSLVAIVSLIVALGPTALAQQSASAQSSAATSGTSTAPTAPEAAPSKPAEAASDASAKVVLKDGTPVGLKLAQTISSKTAVVGDTVELVLDEDLMVGQTVAVKKGAKAVGTISNAKKAGMAGRGGELSLHVEYLKVGDTRVKLRGAQGKEGDNKTGATVGLVLAFGVLGFMKHGKQAEVKEGTPVKAYLDQDVDLAAATSAPAK
jgi:hypothetical protein